MSRKNRFFLPNVPSHLLKKGLNEQKIFFDEKDYQKFYEIMNETALVFKIKIYAYILFENFFEFIISSQESEDIIKYMKIISRSYVLYFNKKYNRTGTIFEARNKISLLQTPIFLEKTIIYIDSLAIKYNLQNSFCASAIKKPPYYLDKNEEEFILNCLYSGSVTGDSDYVNYIESMAGQVMSFKKRGRPKGEKIERISMYKKLEVLSREKHYNFKINQLDNLKFAEGELSIPILQNEVEEVSTYLPIVFIGSENITISALTALGRENIAINTNGKWISSYIPAFYRKYPFTYVNNKDNFNEKVVAIDIEAPNISVENGMDLFDTNKEQTQLLKDTINFLTSYEQEFMKMKNIAKVIADSGILEDMEISIGEGEEKEILTKGFKVVDREKLNKLDDETLAKWVRNGLILFIELHLKSLNNIELMMEISSNRKNLGQ